MTRRLSQVDWGYLAAAVLPIIGFLPILRDSIISTADGTVHIYRMFAVIQMAQTGDLWPRWIPYLHLGYGYPMFNFYPLGIYHLALAMSLLGISPPVAYNLIATLAWIIGSVGMYALARTFFPGRAAMLSVALWAFAPMRMYEVWHQGSLPTIMATAFVPWVFWGLAKVVRSPGPRSMLSLTWPFAAMIMSHPPVTFMTGVFLAPAVAVITLWSARQNRPLLLRRLIYVGGGLVMAGLVTAIFLLPLGAELRYIASSGTASDVVPYLRSQYLLPNEIFTLFPAMDMTDLRFDLPTSLGLVGGGLSALGLLGLLRHRQYGLAALLALALAFLVFMLLEVSFPVWLRIPYLAQIRAATRFLSVGSLFIALAGGASLLLLPKRWWTAASAVALPTIVLVVLPLTYANQKTERWDSLTAKDEIEHELAARVWGSTSYDEFDPIWGKTVPLDPPAEPDAYVAEPMRIVVKELDLIKQYPDLQAEQLDTATVKVTVTDARPVRFRQYYFPGWTATLDGQPVEVYPEEEYGLLTVDVPAGEHIINLRYTGTLIQAISVGISAISLILVGAVVYLTRQKAAPGSTPVQTPQAKTTASGEYLDRRFAAIISVGAAGFALANAAFITPNTLLFREKSPPDKPVYMQTAVNQSFGDVFELLGYTLEQDDVAPGGILKVMLFWRPKREITEEFHPVVQLVNLSVSSAWASNEPVLLGNNKTIGYTPDRFASDLHKLRIFDDAPPYVGRLSVQLVNDATREFLRLPNGSDRLLLDPLIRIQGNGTAAKRNLDYQLGNIAELWCSAIQEDDGQFTIDLYWHIVGTPAQELKVFVHGLDVDGDLVNQSDTPAIPDYPATRWLPGQTLRGTYILPTDPEIQTIAVGLYEADSGQRLPATQDSRPILDNRILLPRSSPPCQE